MKTLATCLNKLVLDGFDEDFKVTTDGLYAAKAGRVYQPEQVKIVDFYRFEGASDPSDNAIVYAIRAHDGVQGTLTDAYGPYSDPQLGRFIKKVEEIHKRN